VQTFDNFEEKMNRTLISTGLVAAFGLIGNAYAAGPITAAQALAAPTQIFLSGATANSATIRSAVKTAMCGGTTTADSNEFIASTSGTYKDKFFAIACDSTLTGGHAVFYYTALGSAFGVNPVIYNGSGVKTPQLDLNTCTGLSCSGVTTEANSSKPDIGFADIRTDAFVGPNKATATALSKEFNPVFGNFATAYPALYAAMQEDSPSDGTSNLTAVNGMTFAIAISNTLATALGGTANNQPLGLSTSQSLSRATIAGLLAGAYGSGTTALKALGITDPSSGNTTKVAVCTRPGTSGTKAWSNIFFLGEGAGAKAENVSSGTYGTGGNWSSQQVAYVENAGSSDLKKCLTAASAQGIPAIGIISLEASNLPTGAGDNQYSIARIDGVSPDNATISDRVNTRNGLYTNVGEAYMQTRGDLSSNAQAVLDAMVTALGSSTVCGVSGPTTLPNGNSATGTTCEMRWSRSGNPFNVPKIKSGE